MCEVMVRKMGACEECERTCQLLHGCKRDLDPMVSRFFKVMIGTDFNEALFLPPKFVKNVMDLVGQETELEDSRGICWTVSLSYYKGKLAFHKGWDKFSFDNHLMIGDFLIFNRIKGGHFVVQAFGRDACEKLKPAVNHRPLKRGRTSGNEVSENAPSRTSSREAKKTRSSSRAHVQMQPAKVKCNPKREADENREQQLCADDGLCMMVDRDAGYVQCDDRTWLYDLSNYEMQQQHNIHSVGMTKERIDGQEVNSDAARRRVKLQPDLDSNDKCTNEMVVVTRETAVTPITNNIVRCNNNSEPTCKMSVKHEDNHLDDLRNDHHLAASGRHDVTEGGGKLSAAVLPRSRQIKDGDSPECSQNRSRKTFKMEMVKKVKVEIGEGTYGSGQKRASFSATREADDNSFAASEMSKTMRVIPVPSSGTSSAQTDCWPEVTFPVKGEGRVTTILEDPNGREWAGLYYEHGGVRALLASWDKIKAQNRIQPGDHLVFSVAADKNTNKYKFCIVHK